MNTHSPIYNPGGHGTDLRNEITFTEPNGGQIIAIENAIKNPNTVSWASQNISDYDSADDFAVAFRLRDPVTGSTLLTASSIEANNAIQDGYNFVDVPFAVNSTDSFSKDVVELINSDTGDLVYASRKKRIKKFLDLGYENNGNVFTSYNKKFRGLDAVCQLRSEVGMHTTTADKDELNDLLDIGWERASKAFYSVGFDNI